MALRWYAYVMIGIVVVAAFVGLFAWWYRRKQYAYTHGTFRAPNIMEIVNPDTDEFQMIKAFYQAPGYPQPGLIDRTILMKKAKHIMNRAPEEGVNYKLWIPRSFPDKPLRP